MFQKMFICSLVQSFIPIYLSIHPFIYLFIQSCICSFIDLLFFTDYITATLQSTPSKQPLYIGPVLLSVSIHDPSHMFIETKYYWDFGDGSYLNNSNLGQLSHNFTEKNIYNIKVVIFSMAHGRLFNGTINKDLRFEGKIYEILGIAV